MVTLAPTYPRSYQMGNRFNGKRLWHVALLCHLLLANNVTLFSVCMTRLVHHYVCPERVHFIFVEQVSTSCSSP